MTTREMAADAVRNLRTRDELSIEEIRGLATVMEAMARYIDYLEHAFELVTGLCVEDYANDSTHGCYPYGSSPERN